MAAKRIWQAEQGPTEGLLISPKQRATVLSLCNTKSNTSEFTYWLQSPLAPALLPPEITPAPHKLRAGGLALRSPAPTQNREVRAVSTSLLSLFPTWNIYPTSHINDAGTMTAVPGVSCTAPGTISSLLLNGTQHCTSRWVRHTLNQSKKGACEDTKLSIWAVKCKYLTQVVNMLKEVKRLFFLRAQPQYLSLFSPFESGEKWCEQYNSKRIWFCSAWPCSQPFPTLWPSQVKPAMLWCGLHLPSGYSGCLPLCCRGCRVLPPAQVATKVAAWSARLKAVLTARRVHMPKQLTHWPAQGSCHPCLLWKAGLRLWSEWCCRGTSTDPSLQLEETWMPVQELPELPVCLCVTIRQLQLTSFLFQ